MIAAAVAVVAVVVVVSWQHADTEGPGRDPESRARPHGGSACGSGSLSAAVGSRAPTPLLQEVLDDPQGGAK